MTESQSQQIGFMAQEQAKKRPVNDGPANILSSTQACCR